jgi:hypothetical protein
MSVSLCAGGEFLTLCPTFREPKIPDPVKLVRRLTALEIALGNLKQDCQVISTKRNDIVQSVMDAQLKTVTQVQEVRISFYRSRYRVLLGSHPPVFNSHNCIVSIKRCSK